MVKCCRTYEEVYDGDVGKVIKLDRDGLHDLNVQCDWQQKGGTYWVRYIHIELLGTSLSLLASRKTPCDWSASHPLLFCCCCCSLSQVSLPKVLSPTLKLVTK